MIFSKCENCNTRDLWPRKRRYNFDFLPLGIITSEDKLCGLCFMKVVLGIKMTHKEPITLLENLKYKLCKIKSRKTSQ